MIPLVRQCLPGELWWSAIARHVDLVGLNTPGTTHQLLVGNRRSIGSPLFPRQVEATIDSLKSQSNATDIIANHTMLPLYAAFLHPNKIAQANSLMLGNGNVEFALGIAAMGDYPITLKGCRDCIVEEGELHGTASWQTAHQAPGVVMCFRHRRALWQANVSARVKSQIAHFVAIERAQFATGARIPLECFQDALWLADSGRSLLEHRPKNPGLARLTSLYRKYLRKHDLLDEFGRLALRDFTYRFITRMGPTLRLLQCDAPNPSARDNWLARLARYPRSEQSPLKHLLLMRFLDLDVLSALQEADSLRPVCAPYSLCAPIPKRSLRVTDVKAQSYRSKWLELRAHHSHGSLRLKADRIYSWLWRNDRAWLRYYARPLAKADAKRSVLLYPSVNQSS